MRTPSDASAVIGFSTSTLHPASKAASAGWRCLSVGVAMITPSGSVAEIRLSMQSNLGTPRAAERRAGSESAMPINSVVGQSATYQFPTHNSVIISCALMVRFRCIRGTKIVHATRNLRIPRSGCRFDLWNPSPRPLIRGLSGSAELSATRQQAAKGRNAESSVSY